VKYYNNLQLKNDIGLREGTAYRPTSLTVLIEANHKCGRMRRESRPQPPACLMYLAWPFQRHFLGWREDGGVRVVSAKLKIYIIWDGFSAQRITLCYCWHCFE